MRTTRAILAITIVALMALAGIACGSSGSDSSSDSDDTSATTADATTDEGSDDATSDGSDDSSDDDPATGPLLAGSLTVDGEDIELNPGRCLLEEQPSAGGGGVLEATAQGTGTNRAGDQVVVDFTRYSADSQFAGDDVSVTIGDPFDGATELGGTADSGTVAIDGFEVSATDFEVSDESGTTQAISFTINC